MKANKQNIRFTLACFMTILLITSCVWQIIVVNNREAKKTNTYEIDIDNDGIIDAVVEGKLTVLAQEKEAPIGQKILVRISHYNPALGGVNCLTFVDGQCVSPMTNGQDWKDWIDKAIACPAELPFETKIVINGREWVCKDRGGAVVYDGVAFWVDQLTATPEYPYGTTLEAVAYIP